MAAQRIRAANSGGLPRCKSEGTLIDLSEGFAETSLCDVKGAEGWVGTMPPHLWGPGGGWLLINRQQLMKKSSKH